MKNVMFCFWGVMLLLAPAIAHCQVNEVIRYICPGDSVRLVASSDKDATFEWYRNDILISGLNENTLYTADTGIYTAIAVMGGECISQRSKPVRLMYTLPHAVDDTVVVYINKSLKIEVNLNDTNDCGNIEDLSVRIVNHPSMGRATVEENGSIKYEPDRGTRGIDSFRYQLINGNGTSNSALVTVSIEEEYALIYPNPVTDFLHVEVFNKAATHILLTDRDGRVVKREQITGRNMTLRFEGLASSIYILSLLDERGIVLHSYKIIKRISP